MSKAYKILDQGTDKTKAVMPELGGEQGPPQYLVDQLTLFKPGRADYPHLLLLAPQCF